MTVQDDLRRMSQLDSIYLGTSHNTNPGSTTTSVTSWCKGRLQQANDGNWLFRSISSDGTIVGVQLGSPNQAWTSNETPSTGITVTIPINFLLPPGSIVTPL